MQPDGTLSIRINGEHRRVASGITIAQLASEVLGLGAGGIVVERNLDIVPRETLGETLVEDGDELEITPSIGGGDLSPA
jgi:thiazole synthase